MDERGRVKYSLTWLEANKDKIRGCLVRHPHLRVNCIFFKQEC